MSLGAVAALYRYPVKSMLGERLGAVEVTDRGPTGDRGYALLDSETGKVVSAKSPRLWRQLLTCTATLTPAGPRVTAPDGTELPDADSLSALLGRKVVLTDVPPPDGELDRSRPDEVLAAGPDAQVAADIVRFGSASPPGTFFDFAPVHLITTSTLARIAELSPAGTAEAARYRPNLLIDTGGADGDGNGFVEHAWVGQELRIGEELTLRVIASTPRCAVPTLAHGHLPRDPDALRVLARHNRVPALPGRAAEPCAGVYAQVVRGGWVREGDAVRS
ncbi:MOSC N-terminal beta barrel domain-containing protein [Streptomyces sp. NPDC047081]|uniref:MOSC domain-containing protein n=1 Tax=Streptomyces sp. NPDC047081 TaxID=3154706 RepID=UPI0033D0E4B0